MCCVRAAGVEDGDEGGEAMVTVRASWSMVTEGGQGILATVFGWMKPWGLGSSGERRKW